MIEKLIVEKGHNKRLENLTLEQQKQYNKILSNIEVEKTKYIVTVDLATLGYKDYSAICKGRFKEGVFCIENFEYIKPEDNYKDLESGLYISIDNNLYKKL